MVFKIVTSVFKSINAFNSVYYELGIQTKDPKIQSINKRLLECLAKKKFSYPNAVDNSYSLMSKTGKMVFSLNNRSGIKNLSTNKWIELNTISDGSYTVELLLSLSLNSEGIASHVYIMHIKL